jgi:hypothetical protein
LWHLTWVEVAIIIGSFGWFMTQFLLFVKVAPSLPIAEVKRDVIEGRRMIHDLTAAGLMAEPQPEVTSDG